MDSLLDIRNLEVRFSTWGGIVKALNGVDLTVGRGQVVGLIGESGSGKTVTGYSILRVLATPPGITNGEIWFEGEDLLRIGGEAMGHIRGKKITMISQDPLSSLNPVFTIGEQLVDSIVWRGIGGNAAARVRASLGFLDRFTPNGRRRHEQTAQIAAEYLALVGMPSLGRRLGTYPHELSGGMRQRVLIAVASMSRPSLLIADEPTTSLDVSVQAQILSLMRGLVEEKGMSILYISHDLGVVAQLSDRVAVMYGGQIVEEASVHDIFGSPMHPYTTALVKATRLRQGEGLIEIPGEVPDLINPPPGCHFSPRCPEAIPLCTQFEPESCEVERDHKCKCGKVHGQWKQ